LPVDTAEQQGASNPYDANPSEVRGRNRYGIEHTGGTGAAFYVVVGEPISVDPAVSFFWSFVEFIARIPTADHRPESKLQRLVATITRAKIV